MSSRIPPPQGAPPSYAFVTRVYRSDLRPVVLGVTFFGGLWSLFSAIGFFRSIPVDNGQGEHKLAIFALALGIMYITVFAIEAFGFFSAAVQRLALIRIYAFLSVLATALFVGSELVSVVVHFTLKSDILNECTQLSKGDTIVTYPFGFFGPQHSEPLSPTDAASWCQSVYDRQSWSGIVSLIITALLALLFLSIAFAYYRQVLDPSSPANASRIANQGRMGGAFPSHYNPPYNASVPNLGYGYNAPYANGPSGYAPPPGPPPAQRDAPFAPPYDSDSKPPGYIGGDKYGADSKEDDPFADFDGPSRPSEEHDVTSRPAPGGRDTFR